MILNFPTKEERLLLNLKDLGVTDITQTSSNTGIAVEGKIEGIIFRGYGDSLEQALEMLISSTKILEEIRSSMLLSLLDDYTD